VLISDMSNWQWIAHRLSFSFISSNWCLLWWNPICDCVFPMSWKPLHCLNVCIILLCLQPLMAMMDRLLL